MDLASASPRTTAGGFDPPAEPPAADCRSPFGALLAEIREERIARRVTAGPAVPRDAERGSPAATAEPELHIETGIVSQPLHRLATPRRLLGSAALHGAVVVALIAVPLLRSDDGPSAVSTARAFFVEPVLAPPAPPPPPAPRATAAAPRAKAAPTRPTMTAPARTPDDVKPADIVESTPSAAEAGAVEGGVPGGVAGGVIGGVLSSVPEPAPLPPQQVRAGVQVKEPKKLKDVEPVYPPVAIRGNVEGIVVLDILINARGQVEQVRVLRGIPLLDAAAVAAAKQWLFTPTLLDGVPVSVNMTVTVRFALK